MRPPGRAHQLGAQLVQGAVAARPAPLLHRHRLPRVPGAPAPHRPLEGARQSPPEVFQPRAGGPGRLRDVHAFGALDAGPGARARLPLGGAPGAFPLCCGRRPPGPSHGNNGSQPPGHVLLKASYFQVRERGRGQLTEHAEPLPRGTPLSLRHSEALHFSQPHLRPSPF